MACAAEKSANALPSFPLIGIGRALHYRNYPMTKDVLKALIADCLTICGEETTVRLLDDMKRLGYQYATKSGISFALSDIVMPPERDTLIQLPLTQHLWPSSNAYMAKNCIICITPSSLF